MRKLLALIDLLIAALIVAALAVFAAQNTATMSFHFVGTNFSDTVWHIAIACAVLGFILALLLLMPGLLASGWRARRLAQEHGRLRGDVEGLRAHINRLQADREATLAERRNAQPAAPVVVPPPRIHDGHAGRAAGDVPRTGATVPPAQPVAPADAAQLAPTVPAPVVTDADQSMSRADQAVPEPVPVTPRAVAPASVDGTTGTPSLDNTAAGNPGDRSGLVGSVGAPSVPSLDNTATGSPGGLVPSSEPLDGYAQSSDREVLAPWLR